VEGSSTSHSKDDIHHKRTGGRISYLASSSNSREFFFTGLFILFAFLEESLRDFNVLHDQQVNCWSHIGDW
jgi:hypothetical protein